MQPVVERAMLAGRTVSTVGSGVEVWQARLVSRKEANPLWLSLLPQESPSSASWRGIILGMSSTKLLVSSVLSSQQLL